MLIHPSESPAAPPLLPVKPRRSARGKPRDMATRQPGVAEQPPSPIVRAILAYLAHSGLAPGDRLPSERALAEQLGVGRNALREALATLGTLRVLESRPNSGIYLRRVSTDSSFETLVLLADMGASPTPAEIDESMEVRTSLELLAVQLACERWEPADLLRIEGVLTRTERLLADNGNISEEDTAFHLALLEATHNGVLVRVLNSFYCLTAARRRALFANTAQGRASAADHRALFEAVKAREVRLAQDLIRRHIGRARSYWSEVLGPG